MNSVAIIGCGGIGSVFASALKSMIDKEQLPLLDVYTLIDFDSIDPKNLLYQNFKEEDLGKNKAEVLAKRYAFKFKNEKVTEEKQLDPYNKIIICADNTIVRELCYRHCVNKKKFFLDLRCQGRINAYLVYKQQTLKNLLKTLPARTETGSCQIEQRLEQNMIDVCNYIIVWKGIQILLNLNRGIDVDDYATENV